MLSRLRSRLRSLFRRKRIEPCGFEWIARRRIRVPFSSTPGEWWEEDEICILAKGHAGSHQSEYGFRHD